MKKLFLLASMVVAAITLNAQTNLQVFYDFGDTRKQVTTTFEMFKADKWGDTFFFIDHDFASNVNDEHNYPSGTYFEIARAFNFWQDSSLAPWSLHAEYNGGVYETFGVNSAWLFGLNYFIHSADFKYTLTLEALYKTIRRTDQNTPLQFTVVWGISDFLGIKNLKFSGFADFWWEDHMTGDAFNTPHHTVFLSEPQLWYNLGKSFGCDNFHIGGEVELSNNFGSYDGFKVNPCLGVKWDF